MTQLRRGPKLGKYRLERRLGVGAFADVWRARDTVERRDVALKIAAPEISARFGRDSIEQEARIAASLDQPNIVAVRNADWIGGYFVIATDLARALERAARRAAAGMEGPPRRPPPRRAKRSPFGIAVNLFQRRCGRALELRYDCFRCGGQISEAMRYCPWCIHALLPPLQDPSRTRLVAPRSTRALPALPLAGGAGILALLRLVRTPGAGNSRRPAPGALTPRPA